MRRWKFTAAVAGAAGLAAVAQAQTSQVRTVAVALAFQESDLEGQKYFAAFQQELQRLGWTPGGNLKVEVRWGRDAITYQRYELELETAGTALARLSA